MQEFLTLYPNKTTRDFSTLKFYSLKPIGTFVLWLLGWRYDHFNIPNKVVIIMSKHISYCDFIIGLAFTWVLGIEVRFLVSGRHFHIPLIKYFLHFTKAIPADKSSHTNAIKSAGQYLNSNDIARILICPKGQITETDRWEKGFWYIAKRNQLPIQTVFVDHKQKRIFGGEILLPSSDHLEDIKRIQAHYADKNCLDITPNT